jgi:hypothetical protein
MKFPDRLYAASFKKGIKMITRTIVLLLGCMGIPSAAADRTLVQMIFN